MFRYIKQFNTNFRAVYFNKIMKSFFNRIYSLYQYRKNSVKYRSFIRANKIFWNKYYHGKYLIDDNVVVTEAIDEFYYYCYMILSNVLAINKKARVLYLDWGKNNTLNPIRDSFSPCLHLYVDDLVRGKEREIEKDTLKLYESVESPEELLELKYQDILIGDLVYDLALRTGHWQATIWRIDTRIYRLIKDIVITNYALGHLSAKYNITASNFSHTVGIASGGYPLRYFVNKGIESYSGGIGNGNIKKYHSFDGYRIPHFGNINKDVVREITGSESYRGKVYEKAKSFMASRFSGKSIDHNSQKAFSSNKKTYESKSKFCKKFDLDPTKKNVFVMLHAFNDFPNTHKKNLFIDYYHWFIETLKIAQKSKNVNWIFKEHPSAQYYPDDANLSGIFEFIDDGNVIFMDRHVSFNSNSLLSVADVVVTCIGSAALEFACFGIPSVLGGQNKFSGFGLCTEPRDYTEYEDILRNINQDEVLVQLNDEKQEYATLLFYMLYHFSMGRSHVNNGFVPLMAHEELLAGNYEDIYMNYVESELKKKQSVEFLDKLSSFINNYDQEDLVQLEHYLR